MMGWSFMDNLFLKEDFHEVSILNKNLELLRSGYKIDDSSELLILYNICESIVRLSKKYQVNNSIYKDINKYRQKIAHSKSNVEEISNLVSREYNELINEFKTNKIQIDDIFIDKRDNEYKYIEDSTILNILEENDMDNFPLFRLTGIPEHSKFNDERNYLLFSDDCDNEDTILEVMQILDLKIPKLLFMRKFYKIKNNKNTSMEW